MRTRLTSIGSDVAIVLDNYLRDALKVSPHDEVEVEVHDDRLVVRAVREEQPQPDTLAAAFRSVLENSDEIAKRTHWRM